MDALSLSSQDTSVNYESVKLSSSGEHRTCSTSMRFHRVKGCQNHEYRGKFLHQLLFRTQAPVYGHEFRFALIQVATSIGPPSLGREIMEFTSNPNEGFAVITSQLQESSTVSLFQSRLSLLKVIGRQFLQPSQFPNVFLVIY